MLSSEPRFLISKDAGSSQDSDNTVTLKVWKMAGDSDSATGGYNTVDVLLNLIINVAVKIHMYPYI